MKRSADPSSTIRTLNREFRRLGPLLGRQTFDGVWLVAAGVQDLGAAFTWSALSAAQTVVANNGEADTYDDDRFGSFEIGGRRVFWQIDYVQRGRPFAAEKPADNAATCRVMIIMLEDEG